MHEFHLQDFRMHMRIHRRIFRKESYTRKEQPAQSQKGSSRLPHLLLSLWECVWKKDFSVGICVRWERYSHCFRCFRSLHCTATEKIVSRAVVDARRNVHPGSDSRKTDHSKSREIVSNARNVLIPVQRSISIQESKV